MANEVRVLIKANDQASKGIKDVGDAAEHSSGPVGKLGNALGDVAKIASGFVIGQGLLALPGLVSGMIGGASDLSESLSKVQVVFGDSSGAIEKWAGKASTAMGISKSEALAAAGTFGNLFKTMGLGEGDVTSMSQGVVGLATDLASFNNIAGGDALDKLRAGLVGEAEPLRALGVNLNAAMVESKALEMGLVDANGEVTEAGKVQARYALILEQTTTAQGDFARTSDGHANQMRILKARFADMRDEIGTALLPVVVKLGEVFLDVMPKIAGFVSGGIDLAKEGVKKFAEVAGPTFSGVKDAIFDAVGAIGEKLQEFAGWLGPNGIIALALGGPIGLLLQKLFDVDIIGGFKKVGDFIASTAIPAVKDFATDGLDFLKGKGSDLAGFMKGTVGPALADFGALLKDTVLPASKDLVNAGWDRMAGPLGGVGKALTDLFNSVRGVSMGDIGGAFGGLVGAMQPVLDIWKELGQGILQELRDMFSDVGAALKEELLPAFEAWGPAIEKAMPGRKALGESVILVAAITGALVVLREIIPIISVVLVGAIKALAVVIEGLAGVFEGTFKTIEGVWNTFKGLFTGDWDLMWDGIKQTFEGVFTILGALAETGLGLLKVLFETAYQALNELTQGKLGEVVGWFAALPGNVLGALGDLTGTLVGAGGDLLNGLKDGFVDLWNAFQMSWLWGFGALIVGAIGDVSKVLWDVGKAIIQSLWDGMKAVWNQVAGWLGSLGGAIKGLKGPIEEDRTLLLDEGKAIMEGLGAGMEAGFSQHVVPVLKSTVANIVDAMKQANPKSILLGGGGGSGMFPDAGIGAVKNDIGRGTGLYNGDAYPIPFGEMVGGMPNINIDQARQAYFDASGRMPTDEELQRSIRGMLTSDMQSLAMGSPGYVGGSFMDYFKPDISAEKNAGAAAHGGVAGRSTGRVGDGATIVINTLDAASFRDWLKRGGGDEIAAYFGNRKVFA